MKTARMTDDRILRMGEQAERVDSASRVILASPRILFRTFRDTETLKA